MPKYWPKASQPRGGIRNRKVSNVYVVAPDTSHSLHHCDKFGTFPACVGAKPAVLRKGGGGLRGADDLRLLPAVGVLGSTCSFCCAGACKEIPHISQQSSTDHLESLASSASPQGPQSTSHLQDPGTPARGRHFN